MIMIDIDMPDNCDECRFITEYGFCKAMPDNFCGSTDDKKRPEWCPLKEQEARVMTVDEVRSWVMIDRIDREPIVVELRDRFIAWVISDEYYDLPECNLSSEFYGKTWRCWTTRPTDEQRKTVKWE